jgi:hypothetical protein
VCKVAGIEIVTVRTRREKGKEVRRSFVFSRSKIDPVLSPEHLDTYYLKIYAPRSKDLSKSCSNLAKIKIFMQIGGSLSRFDLAKTL